MDIPAFNIKVYLDTINHCNNANFPLKKSIKYSYDDDQFDTKTILRTGIKYGEPVVIVANMDSFDMAIKMGSNPLVLNLASYTSSGGGVNHGTVAQEEDLYRRSNYYQVNPQNNYPLAMNEVVYSPLVHIIKNSNYQYMDKPVTVSCLAVSAIRNPVVSWNNILKRNTFSKHNDAVITQSKIDMIFKVAIKHGHKDLVLGALGCGVYRNPPEEIATMFKIAIANYGVFFERIGFAILSKSDNENYKIFKNILRQ